MNLRKKKNLAAKVMNVGRERIILNNDRLDEIKEAITRNDMLELIKDKAITIREVKGRRKKEKRKRRKRLAGNVRKKIGMRKENYMTNVRKLRRYTSNLNKLKKIDKKKYHEIRKKIRQKTFKDIKHLINETK